MKRKIYINAIRINSGGALVHLDEILPIFRDLGYDWKIYLPKRHFKRYQMYSKNAIFLNYSLIGSLFWELRTSSILYKSKENILLLNFDSGSLLNTKKSISINQDLFCFENFPEYKIHPRFLSFRLFFLYYVQKRSMKLSVHTVFLTHYAASLLSKKVENLNYTVIGHGLAQYAGEIRKNVTATDNYTITYVSGWDKYKNHVTLLKALSLIEELPEHEELVINLVGGGSDSIKNRLRRCERKFQCNIKVRYYDFLPKKEVESLIRKSQGLLYLSSCEAFGITGLEMVQRGLPLVCSFRSAIPEVLGGSIYYINPSNSHSIARGICDLLKNRVYEPKSLDWNRFDWDNIREKYKSLITEYAEV